MIRFVSLTTAFFLFLGCLQAGFAADESWVQHIKSVEQAKNELREAFEDLNACGTGGCYDFCATNICELVATLDVRVGYKITGNMTGVPDEIPITNNDLKMMQRILSFCKPTNYKYWDHGSMLHVAYKSSKKRDEAIQKWLGVKKKTHNE